MWIYQYNLRQLNNKSWLSPQHKFTPFLMLVQGNMEMLHDSCISSKKFLYFQISDWTGVAFQDKKYTSKLHFLHLPIYCLAWKEAKGFKKLFLA